MRGLRLSKAKRCLMLAKLEYPEAEIWCRNGAVSSMATICTDFTRKSNFCNLSRCNRWEIRTKNIDTPEVWEVSKALFRNGKIVEYDR